MNALDQAAQAANAHLSAAKARIDALDIVRFACDQIEALGFHPTTEWIDGFLCLKLDPDHFDLPRISNDPEGDGPVVVVDQLAPAPIAASPAPEFKPDPKPAPAQPKKPPAKAPKTTGLKRPKARREGVKAKDIQAWSADDIEAVIVGVLAGKKAKQLAGELNRDLKQVQNKVFNLKKTIEARRGEGWLDIEQHLSKLPADPKFSPERDLRFAELIRQGTGIAGAGAVLKIQPGHARARWAALSEGRTTHSELNDLVAALKARVAAGEGVGK